MEHENQDNVNVDFADFLHAYDPAFSTAAPSALLETTADPTLTAINVPSLVGPTHITSSDTDDPVLAASVQAADYDNFEHWISDFVKPKHPCNYCGARKLDCILNKRDLNKRDKSCNACSVLFRECSLSNSNTLEAINFAWDPDGTFLDTLHPIDENTARERGELTGIKPLASKTGRSGGMRSSSPSPARGDDEPGSTKRNGIRFPRHAVKILREWLESHADHPYPTEEEKVMLERETELQPTQIANWLANARRRRKASSKVQPRVGMSPSLKPTTLPIEIPAAEKPWDELDPMERWKHSPPQNEPASITDIALAVANSELPAEDTASGSSSLNMRRRKRSSNGSHISGAHAPSTTSFETDPSSFSASSHVQTHGSNSSHGSSYGSFDSKLAGKRDRRRRRRQPLIPSRTPADTKKRIFQCTFCTDTFKSKYDWTRHEKSLHLSLEKWICAPDGPVYTDHETGERKCTYCSAVNPTSEHVETHNHKQCTEKGQDARTFYRKDHLRQHLRLMHGSELLPIMEAWKSTATHINSRCGFCAKRFCVWQERVDHLTAHFKAGARMADWKGCRGLDPAVAVQVTNAMPPYLIGLETLSPVPFSATDNTVCCLAMDSNEKAALQDPGSNPTSRTTCWERLTIRLGKYATKAAAEGIVLTDEMLQREARIILYESDDSWNTTAADNPEWLDLFKKAHGLDIIPPTIGGAGDHIPEDLEAYGDLGLRIPLCLRLAAYNQAHASSSQRAEKIVHPTEEERRAHLLALGHRLTAAQVLRSFNRPCGHSECANNILDLTDPGTVSSDDAIKRWCNYEVQTDKSRELLGPAILQQGGSMAGNEFSNVASTGPDPVDTFAQGPETTGKQPYLPYHRLKLPADKARRFDTITGEWEESGLMPEPISSVPSYEKSEVTTGAMMEFLGPSVGQNLPFSQDPATSIITGPVPVDWMTQEGVPEDEKQMLENIERLIKETSASASQGSSRQHSPTSSGPTQQPQTIQNLSGAEMDAMLMPTTSAPNMAMALDAPMDFTMDDVNFDDLTFDDHAIFDMNLDEQHGAL